MLKNWIAGWVGVMLCAGPLAAQTNGTPELPPDQGSPTSASLGCCGPCCAPCGPSGDFWVQGEYLLWAITGSPLPPLLTAAPRTSPAAAPGALGNPDTVILFGDSRVNDGLRSGFRIRAGFWLDECHEFGLEGGFFYLDPARKRFDLASDASDATVARPFFNTATGMPGSQLISLAGVATGSVSVFTKSEFTGADLNARCKLCCHDECCRGYRIDLLTGYRFNSLREDLQIYESVTLIDPAGNPVGTLGVADRFRTNNQFHGLQMGVDAEVWRKRWFVNVRGLLGVGLSHQTVDVEGSTTTAIPGAGSAQFPGGILALSSNIGHHSRDPFAFAPELSVALGYKFSEHLRATVGYNLLYWSSVVRPGNQIDLTVNPDQVPPALGAGPFTPPRPEFSFKGSDFWAQGSTLGLELRF
jgi:hypothetical protein